MVMWSYAAIFSGGGQQAFPALRSLDVSRFGGVKSF